MLALITRLAPLIRALIIAISQGALLIFAEKYILPILDSAIKEIAQLLGCTESEAEDIVANQFIQGAETIGILLFGIKSKIPVKIAERLGFTSKGYALRKLSPTLEAKIPKLATAGIVTSVATAVEIEKIAEVVAINRGVNLSTVKTVYAGIMSFVGVSALVMMTIGNFIDFANWQGAYQKTFEKLFASLGFPPDSPMPKSKAVSADTWSKIYTIVEEMNPESISFPWTGETKVYSRTNLADAVDHFATNLALNSIDTTYKHVWGLLLPCIKLKGGAPASASVGALGLAGVNVPQIQVFSGVLSQGFLGKGVEFQSRPNDLIENATELIQSATNNLAPFLASVPGMITYQIKVVPSITTKDGFTQRGSAVQVLSGYSSNGTPKYKTIINKFATVDLYILTDKGQRVKFKTIILGPVDSVKFSVSTQVLTQVDSALKTLVSTSNIIDIKGLETIAPITITTPKITTPAPALPAPVVATDTMQNYVIGRYGDAEIWTTTTLNSIKALPKEQQGQFREITQQEYNQIKNPAPVVQPSAPVPSPYTSTPAPVVQNFTPAPVVQNFTPAPAPAPVVKPGANAQTLAEWYSANGQSLPSVSARSSLYQQYNLGPASYYAGTAEQNTKLLSKLKGF